MRPRWVRIASILEHWDPFSVLLLVYEDAPEKLREAPPEPYTSPAERVTNEWHWGRVGFLIEHPADDPIILRREPNGGWTVLDGNHRLCAAILRGEEAILAVSKPAGAFPEWILHDLQPDG